MTQLCIQQKVFSWRDRFTVWDPQQNPVYSVEGEVFTLGKKLHIYDQNGQEAGFIAQECFHMMPQFQIECLQTGETATLRQRFQLFSERFELPEKGWSVEGSFMGHNYKILSPEGEIAVLEKEWFTWGDTYQLTVYREEDAFLALAVILVIDAVHAQSN